MKPRPDIIDQLLRFQRNELPPEEMTAIADRLSKEPELRELLGLVTKLDTRTGREAESELNRAASALADRIYQDYLLRGRGSRIPVGVTIFDSKLLPIPAGVRPATVDTRQLRFQLADTEVILMLYPVAPDSYEIMGQIGEDFATGAITLELNKRGFTAAATVDEFGLFRFDRVPLGTYRLTFSADHRAVGLIHVTI